MKTLTVQFVNRKIASTIRYCSFSASKVQIEETEGLVCTRGIRWFVYTLNQLQMNNRVVRKSERILHFCS